LKWAPLINKRGWPILLCRVEAQVGNFAFFRKPESEVINLQAQYRARSEISSVETLWDDTDAE
jgi:hypothetical protein